jgi:hypothetical protein
MAACGCSRVIAQLALDSFCSPEVKLTMPEVSLTPLDPVIQLAGPAGEAEAADFVMAMGPLMRVLPSLSAAQRENVRATLEVYFKGHATPQDVVLPAANWVVRARV